MARVYFVNTKNGKEYDVIKFDKEKQEITLRGAHATFVEPMDKERMAKMGYELRQDP